MIHNLGDLVEQYACRKAIPKAQAEKDIKIFLDVLSNFIVDGGIVLKGLFSIKHKRVKGRTRILYDKVIDSEDFTSLRFLPSDSLITRINADNRNFE